MDNITRDLLEKIANLHDIPSGAVSLRVNGKSEAIRSTEHIEIEKKEDKAGINIYIHSTCQGESCHIPVVISNNGLFDLVYNDFYIEDGANVTIVAGCGVHSDDSSGHDGIHSFHIGKNAMVTYIENHVAIGKGSHKVMNPTTIVEVGENSTMIMNTTQLSGVDYSNRTTKVRLKKNASIKINEKILTEGFNVAKTDFVVDMSGVDSKCNIISRSVAKGESEQVFKSNLKGNNRCFGHVECDGILLDRSKIDSIPRVSAKHPESALSHEAAIGKISEEQIMKLMTLGLNKKQAEEKIIEGFLK